LPNGLGYDTDAAYIHPYQTFPQINALTGIYMLKATRTLLTSLGLPNKTLNVYLTGFSEGGAYALWASYLFYKIIRSV
jgi:hypothetical protein